jgi:hypothetical protein
MNTLNYDPSTITGAIIWGVVAGAITSTILLVVAKIFSKIILPWYQDLIYKGVDLQGKWVSQKTYPNGITYHYTLTLRQNAHRLDGNMTISKMNSSQNPSAGYLGDYVQAFTVSGTTWEGFVTLNMTSNDRRSLSFATSLLQVRDRGLSLIGHMAYRSSRIDQVDSEDIAWSRS